MKQKTLITIFFIFLLLAICVYYSLRITMRINEIELMSVRMLTNQCLDYFEITKTRYNVFKNEYEIYLSSTDRNIKKKMIVYDNEKNSNGEPKIVIE